MFVLLFSNSGGVVKKPLEKLKPSLSDVRAAFALERIGKCYINVCANGETLARKELLSYLKVLLELGHVVEVVTNATLSERFHEISLWDKALLSRLVLKCSLHYLELKKHGLLEQYASNIRLLDALGVSYTIELVGADIYLPCKDEIKDFCIKSFGALPHVTIARDDRTQSIDYYTSLSEQDYEREWAEFDSFMFEYKTKIYHNRKKRFCYAGARSLYVNLNSGNAHGCYASGPHFDFYDLSINPKRIRPVGKNCPLAYCYNGHSLYALGLCPSFSHTFSGNYLLIRDRVSRDGTHWIKEPVASLFSRGLSIASHPVYEFRFGLHYFISGFVHRLLVPLKRLITH